MKKTNKYEPGKIEILKEIRCGFTHRILEPKWAQYNSGHHNHSGHRRRVLPIFPHPASHLPIFGPSGSLSLMFCCLSSHCLFLYSRDSWVLRHVRHRARGTLEFDSIYTFLSTLHSIPELCWPLQGMGMANMAPPRALCLPFLAGLGWTLCWSQTHLLHLVGAPVGAQAPQIFHLCQQQMGVLQQRVWSTCQSTAAMFRCSRPHTHAHVSGRSAALGNICSWPIVSTCLV